MLIEGMSERNCNVCLINVGKNVGENTHFDKINWHRAQTNT